MEPPVPTSHLDPERSMKSLLSDAVREAVKLGLIDAVLADGVDELQAQATEAGVEFDWGAESSRLRAEWDQDVHAIPSHLLARMDPSAMAGNVACRLLGTGGWSIAGVYTGNATPAEVLDLSIARPHRDPIGEVAMDVAQQLGGKVETDFTKIACGVNGHDWHVDPEIESPFERCANCGETRPF